MQEVLVRNSIGEAKLMEDRYTPDVMNESRDSCFTSNDREHRKGNNVDDAVASIFARKSSIASSRKVSIMDSVEALTREVQEIERQISRQQGNAFNAGDEGTLMMLHSKPSSLSAKSSPEDLPFEVRPYLLSGLGGARERLPLSEEEDNQEVDAAVNSINANKRTVDVYSRRPADTMRSLPKDQEKKHDEFRRDLTTEDPTYVHPRAFSALREGISSQTKSLQRRTGIERLRTHAGKFDDDRSSLGDANAQEQKPHTRSGSRPKIGCSGVRKQGETMKTNADRQTGLPASKDILPRMCSHHTSTPLSSHKISTFAENSPMLEMQPYVLSSQATPTPRKAPGGRSATPTPHKKILPHVAQHSKPWGANPSQSPAQQAASNRRSSSPAVQCGLKDSTITRAGSHLLLVGKSGKNNSSPSLQNNNNGVTPLSKQTPRVTRGMGTAQIRSASTSSIRGTMQLNPTRTHREPAIGTSRAERGRTPRSKVPENHRPILSNNGPSMPETSITTKNENKRLTKDSETRESNEPLMYRHDEPAGLILHGSHHAKISSGAPSATLARQYSSSPELDASEDLEALVSKKLVERIKMRPDHSGSCAHVETVPTLPRPGPEDRESLPFHPNTEGAGDIGTSIPTLQARIFHLEGEVHCLRTSHDTLTHQYHEYRAQTDHRMTQLQTQLEAALQWIRQVDDYASAFGNGGADTKDASVPKEFETVGGLFTTFMDGANGALSRGRSPPHFRNYTPPQSTVEDFGAITGTPTRRLDLTDESTGVESLSNLPSAAYSKSGEIRTSVVTYTEHEQNMDQTSDCYYDILSATRQRADAHQPGEFQIESPPILPLEMRPQSLSEKKRNVALARNSS